MKSIALQPERVQFSEPISSGIKWRSISLPPGIQSCPQNIHDWKRANGVEAHQRVFAVSPLGKASDTSKLLGKLPEDIPNMSTTDSESEETKRRSNRSAEELLHEAVTCPMQRGPSSPTVSKRQARLYLSAGPLDALRQHLLKLGWAENKDPKSHFYDFKFALSRKDLGIRPSMLTVKNSLLPTDVCLNFFGCTGGLTTKNGLLRNLERHIPEEPERVREGISPSFDLSDMRSVVYFMEAYQQQFCRSLLFQYMQGNCTPEQDQQLRIAWSHARSQKPPTMTKEYYMYVIRAKKTHTHTRTRKLLITLVCKRIQSVLFRHPIAGTGKF